MKSIKAHLLNHHRANSVGNWVGKIMKLAFLLVGVLFVFSPFANAQTITGFLVNGVSSNTGPVGATLTIQGSGFGSTQGFSTATLNGVFLAGNGVKPVSWSNTAIVAVIPNTATSGPVVVKVAGKSSNAVNFNIGAVITGVSPSSAPVGGTVTLSGKGFGTGGGVVTFNGTTATTSGWTDASITAQVPSGATSGPIVVTVGSQASNGVAFTPTPVISSLSPNSGLGGATVTIAGASFGPTQGTSTVTFNGVAAAASAWSNTSITVAAPGAGQTGSVVVTVNGVAGPGQLFTYTPQISGLSPNSVLADGSLTIQGSNFLSQQGTSTVTFNGVTAAVSSWGNTSITATVPANVKPGNVVVTVNGAASNSFSYTLPALYSYSLSYAPDGHVSSATDSVNGNWTYSYDDFGRLATANNSSPQQGFSYSYDEYANLWKQTLTAGQGGSFSLTFSSSSSASTNGNCYHATGITNQPDGFCYDAAGNLLSGDGSGHTYTYDAENRLIQVDGGQTATYVYDGDGWRVQGPNGQYLYDLQGRVITQIGANGNWSYGEIYAGRRHLGTYSNSTTNFIFADWLGTKRAVVLPSGDVSQICISGPFGGGVQCSGTASTFSGFTDLIHDPETNLEHTSFRKYSSTYGRWTTPDPSMASMNLRHPQSLNRYAYASNDPIHRIDPAGTEDMDAGGGDGGLDCFDTFVGCDGGGPAPLQDDGGGMLDGSFTGTLVGDLGDCASPNPPVPCLNSGLPNFTLSFSCTGPASDPGSSTCVPTGASFTPPDLTPDFYSISLTFGVFSESVTYIPSSNNLYYGPGPGYGDGFALTAGWTSGDPNDFVGGPSAVGCYFYGVGGCVGASTSGDLAVQVGVGFGGWGVSSGYGVDPTSIFEQMLNANPTGPFSTKVGDVYVADDCTFLPCQP